jgi:hypothetical protein
VVGRGERGAKAAAVDADAESTRRLGTNTFILIVVTGNSSGRASSAAVCADTQLGEHRYWSGGGWS